MPLFRVFLACMAGANEGKNELKGIPTISILSPFSSPIDPCPAGWSQVFSLQKSRSFLAFFRPANPSAKLARLFPVVRVRAPRPSHFGSTKNV